MPQECLIPRIGKLILSLVRVGTRKIGLEGKVMNLGLYALNLKYQQYLITYKSYVLI